MFEIELAPAAAKLLRSLDRPVLELHAKLLANAQKSDLRSMIRTLEEIRSGVPD